MVMAMPVFTAVLYHSVHLPVPVGPHPSDCGHRDLRPSPARPLPLGAARMASQRQGEGGFKEDVSAAHLTRPRVLLLSLALLLSRPEPSTDLRSPSAPHPLLPLLRPVPAQFAFKYDFDEYSSQTTQQEDYDFDFQDGVPGARSQATQDQPAAGDGGFAPEPEPSLDWAERPEDPIEDTDQAQYPVPPHLPDSAAGSSWQQQQQRAMPPAATNLVTPLHPGFGRSGRHQRIFGRGRTRPALRRDR